VGWCFALLGTVARAEIDWCAPHLVKKAAAVTAAKMVKPETPQERTTRLKNFYDRNSDGIVDRDEWYQNHFSRVMIDDTNKDHQIIYAEEAREGMRCYLQQLDRNKDGIVSEQEVREHAEAEFLKLDRNNNGQLELGEL